jgi:hypothetical protein
MTRNALCLEISPLQLFEVLQPCINDFFDPMQLGAPHVFSVIESRVHVRPQIAQPRVIDKDPHEYSDRWNAHRKSDLNSLIGHRCLQHTSSEPRPQGAISC